MSAVMLRRAHGDDDVHAVADMWDRAAKRLAERGLDQWQYPVKVHNIRAAVAAGSCWLASDTFGAIIGTITVDKNAQPNLWWPQDKPDNALYLHRMVTEPSVSGQEIGSALIDWAARRAAIENLDWIRLDAWRNNTKLWDYYTAHGFNLVRVVDDPTGSGACFQRSSRVQLGRGPQVVEPTSICGGE